MAKDQKTNRAYGLWVQEGWYIISPQKPQSWQTSKKNVRYGSRSVAHGRGANSVYILLQG